MESALDEAVNHVLYEAGGFSTRRPNFGRSMEIREEKSVDAVRDEERVVTCAAFFLREKVYIKRHTSSLLYHNQPLKVTRTHKLGINQAGIRVRCLNLITKPDENAVN